MKIAPNDQLVLEIDQRTVQFSRKGALPLESVAQVKGDKWFVTDFGAGAPGLATVEAPVAYAEMVLLRKLRERGEAGENARVLAHWKQVRGTNSCELLYTLVEGDAIRHYEDMAREDEYHHLLFASNALLYAILKNHWQDKTVAVLFEHDRHVDCLVGRSGKVLAADRYTSYSTDSKQNLVDQLTEELQAVAKAAHSPINRIVHLLWSTGRELPVATGPVATEHRSGFGAATEKTAEHSLSFGSSSRKSGASAGLEAAQAAIGWVSRLAQHLEAEAVPFKPDYHALAGDEYLLTSITAAIPHLRPRNSSSPTLAHWLYLAQRFLPRVAMGAWAVIGLLFAGAIWLQQGANALESEKNRILAASGYEVAPLVVDPGYKEAVAFADTLDRLQSAPSFHKIMEELSSSRKGKLAFEKLRLEFDGELNASLHLAGRIGTPFEQSNQDHENFIATLNNLGFQVVQERNTTDIRTLDLTLKMKRGQP